MLLTLKVRLVKKDLVKSFPSKCFVEKGCHFDYMLLCPSEVYSESVFESFTIYACFSLFSKA